jgi:hypothetical protein
MIEKISDIAKIIYSRPAYLSFLLAGVLVLVSGIYVLQADDDKSRNSKYETVKLSAGDRSKFEDINLPENVLKNIYAQKNSVHPKKSSWSEKKNISKKNASKKTKWKSKKSSWKSKKSSWKSKKSSVKKSSWKKPAYSAKKPAVSSFKKKPGFGIATMDLFQEVKRAKKVKKRPTFYSSDLQKQFDTAK